MQLKPMRQAALSSTRGSGFDQEFIGMTADDVSLDSEICSRLDVLYAIPALIS
jgi:hypothetical protein